VRKMHKKGDLQIKTYRPTRKECASESSWCTGTGKRDTRTGLQGINISARVQGLSGMDKGRKKGEERRRVKGTIHRSLIDSNLRGSKENVLAAFMPGTERSKKKRLGLNERDDHTNKRRMDKKRYENQKGKGGAESKSMKENKGRKKQGKRMKVGWAGKEQERNNEEPGKPNRKKVNRSGMKGWKDRQGACEKLPSYSMPRPKIDGGSETS